MGARIGASSRACRQVTVWQAFSLSIQHIFLRCAPSFILGFKKLPTTAPPAAQQTKQTTIRAASPRKAQRARNRRGAALKNPLASFSSPSSLSPNQLTPISPPDASHGRTLFWAKNAANPYGKVLEHEDSKFQTKQSFMGQWARQAV